MSTPRYAEILARLLPARRFGVELGLERMRPYAAGKHLGRVIHVGGTNGKGSTVAVLTALARTAGLRVAAYTSPHLSSLRERIAFDGVAISEADFVASAEAIAAEDLTFFEQVTAIALHAIDRRGVDVTLLEVGLGGRLDATNVVDAEVSVVTGVAMDHEAILGDTLAKIAAEKAGIWKAQRHAVIGASGLPDGVPILAAAARATGVASLTIVDELAIAAAPPVALAGAHQRANAAAALAAWRLLGIPTDEGRALASVVHPGRFERIDRFILDGAHNPHGAAALAAALMEQGLRPLCVIAVSADKDVDGIVRTLAPAVAGFIATRYQQERALEPAALAAIIEAATSLPVTRSPDLEAALTVAAAGAATVLVAGSLFLVGEARARLRDVPVDPILATDPAATRPA